MHLVKPDIQFEKSFREGLGELGSEQERREWIYLSHEAYSDFYEISFSDYVNRLIEFEVNPPPHWVPTTIYWAIEDGQMVGRIGIRHKLNDFLFHEGGHIGYFVRHSRRAKGFATEMLKQILETDLAKKIGNLLLTCDEGNFASEKTILNNGGQLENIVSFALSRPPKKRFWIHLE
jgi:predicted acetyltransferase